MGFFFFLLWMWFYTQTRLCPLQLVLMLQWCWVPDTQRYLLFSPSLWVGRESAADAPTTTFEYEHFQTSLFINTSHFSLFNSPFSLLRPWRAKLTCSKVNYKDHVLDTSSWPISLHGCASAWMFIWRQKDKTIAWKDRESSPVRRCACALSGTVRERRWKLLDTFGGRFISDHRFVSFNSGVQIVWSRSSITILRVSSVIAKTCVHIIVCVRMYIILLL